MDAGTLHAEIAKVCPLVGTVVGVADDRTTWSFEPEANATQAQIDAGNNVIATIPVDFKPAPTPTPQGAALFAHENRLRSLEGQPPLTLDQFHTATGVF